MAGNPDFRFRSGSFKTESLIFLTFVFLTFTLKPLFANGFWTSYNRVFSNIQHVEAEMKLSDHVVQVVYDVEQLGQRRKGTGYAISATDEKLMLWNGGGFLKLNKQCDRVIETLPVRTAKKLYLHEVSFAGISFDSLQKLVQDKAILKMKLQAALPVEYLKDNAPQSGTTVGLDHVTNPVLRSRDVGSLDLATAKKIELIKLQIERSEAERRQYEAQRQSAW
ncbi:hypothetical protein HRG84_13510 [Flavisolibacter sp. BT320]|nr:hypothetical protein [Flavisolibacter longurius]